VNNALSSFEFLKPMFMKLGIYIMAPEPISTAYFENPSHQSVCLYVYPPVVARQQLSKKVTASTTIQATVEELLDVSFSMLSGSSQRKVGDYFFPELIACIVFDLHKN
jgi:hypothetical protein